MKKFMSIMMTLVLVFTLCIMPCVSATGFGDKIEPANISGTTEMNTAVEQIIGAIRWAGYIIAVAILIYIGIKYIMASAQEKADLKGQLIKYVIGAVLIIFGTQIAAWAFSIGG